MHDTVETSLSDLAAEFRALLEQVKAERRAVLSIVIRQGHLPTLHALADLFEAQHDGQVH